MERLQKILAQAGVASRRKCEELILQGKVEVDEVVVTELGMKVDPKEVEIKVNGRKIREQTKVYYVFHKPKGVITSLSDPEGRKTVGDFLKKLKTRVYPVGRLDYDSEGLLFLTNDGELSQKLTHPKHEVSKTYLATVQGIPHGTILEQLQKGVQLDDGLTAPAEVEYADVNLEAKEAVLSITIHEGKNRQVRRMLEALGHPVKKLKRIQFGPFHLAGLPRGNYRPLRPDEMKTLRRYLKEKKMD